MEDIISQRLAQALQPSKLEITNESHKHAGHAGDNGSGDSHFFVMVVSEMFDKKSRIDRQRMVYQALEEEMKYKIHALSVKAMTINEYKRML